MTSEPAHLFSVSVLFDYDLIFQIGTDSLEFNATAITVGDMEALHISICAGLQLILIVAHKSEAAYHFPFIIRPDQNEKAFLLHLFACFIEQTDLFLNYVAIARLHAHHTDVSQLGSQID